MRGEFRVQQACRTWIYLCNAPVCNFIAKTKEKKKKKEGGWDGKLRACDFFFPDVFNTTEAEAGFAWTNAAAQKH